jgi:dipeptidyl aminopeptidase/acylaminoacyl peptidase
MIASGKPVIPFGAWPSSLDAGAIAAGSSVLSELRCGPRGPGWLEQRPADRGRVTLVHPDRTGQPEDWLPAPPRGMQAAPWSVRTRVHEYGGGAWLPTGAGEFFVHDDDLHLATGAGAVHRLTRSRGAFRLADFCWDARRSRILAVCERCPTVDHPDADATTRERSDPEPAASLVALPVNPRTGEAGNLVTLHEGHDFYAAPRLDDAGDQLAFVAWDHPNMPWDGSLLFVAAVADDGRLLEATLVAGGAAESVQQPVWLAGGALAFVSDANGFWNVYRYDASGIYCVLDDGAEYADPPWVFGTASVARVGADHVVAARLREGTSELVLIDTATRFATPLDAGWIEHRSLAAGDRCVYFIGARSDAPPAVVCLPLDGSPGRELVRERMPELPPQAVSRAAFRTFRARDGEQVHAYFYAPLNPACSGPADARPPLLVLAHGGPTARTSAALNLRIQFFTSRGWAVLDVDYRGSAGHGRAYRDALNGRWGELDVTDCEDAALGVVGARLADPERIAIRGSSAGGYTVLSALTSSTLFRAGASYYGIGDLESLARTTHKFESRYLDRLVGGAEVHRARSPLFHVDRLRSPVIFFQGTEDRVVPPGQARAMAAAARERGVTAVLIEFHGEGHGFRLSSSIQHALRAEYAFYCRAFGISPAEPLIDLDLENP